MHRDLVTVLKRIIVVGRCVHDDINWEARVIFICPGIMYILLLEASSSGSEEMFPALTLFVLHLEKMGSTCPPQEPTDRAMFLAMFLKSR